MHASKSIVSLSVSFELLHAVKSSLASAPSFSGRIYARLRRILLAVMAKLPGTCERAGVRVERVRSVARIRVRMNLRVCGCVPCVRALGDDTYGSTRKKEEPAAPGKWQFVEETSELGSGDDAFFESFRGCFCSLCLFGIIPSRWFVWNRAQRNESYNLF